MSDLKRGSFFSDQWMKELGLKEKKEWPGHRVKVGPTLLIHHPYSHPYVPLQMSKEMCTVKALITTGYAWKQCRQWGQVPAILIDRYTLKRDGTYQVWQNADTVRAHSVRKFFGKRPWSGDNGSRDNVIKDKSVPLEPPE